MTEIKLHNSMTRGKAVFEPIDPTNVRMYVCGPTVYDRAHIGNARPVVVFDVLYRLLRHVYGADHVTYVRNITDIDDKINARAVETLQQGETPVQAIRRITDMTGGWFKDDMAALGALSPDHQPRATDFVPQMVSMIETLIENGVAYAAEGHVLFEVSKFPEYGALSGRSVDDMIAGARVEVAPYKRDPMDFVLWKPSTNDLPGWDSPWGRGRPGWHIECSAMSSELLGDTFDIHGGGADLQFPHHENEVAQSCCAAPDSGFAKVWLHNGMINVDGRKMSKSLGNFLTVEDLRGKGQRSFLREEALRYAMLDTHFSKTLDWTEKKVEEAEITLDRWHRMTAHLDAISVAELQVSETLIASLADNLNTHLALVSVQALSSTPERLLRSARFLGFLSDEARQEHRERNPFTSEDEIQVTGVSGERYIAPLRKFRERFEVAYKIAKESKNFEGVDSLRSEAKKLGVEVKMKGLTIRVEFNVSHEPDVEVLTAKLEALQ